MQPRGQFYRKKGVILGVLVLILFVSVFSSVMVSAGWWNNLIGKITGNAVLQQTGSQTFDSRILNVSINDFVITAGTVFVTGVKVNWTDSGKNCNAKIIVGEYVGDYISVENNVQKSFRNINKAAGKVRIRIENISASCAKVKINSLTVYYGDNSCSAPGLRLGTAYCNGTELLSLRGNGVKCDVDFQCVSGECFNGRCMSKVNVADVVAWLGARDDIALVSTEDSCDRCIWGGKPYFPGQTIYDSEQKICKVCDSSSCFWVKDSTVSCDTAMVNRVKSVLMVEVEGGGKYIVRKDGSFFQITEQDFQRLVTESYVDRATVAVGDKAVGALPLGSVFLIGTLVVKDWYEFKQDKLDEIVKLENRWGVDNSLNELGHSNQLVIDEVGRVNNRVMSEAERFGHSIGL